MPKKYDDDFPGNIADVLAKWVIYLILASYAYAFICWLFK